MNNKFNPGDKVRILDKYEMSTFNWDEYPKITSDMIKFFGKVVTINSIIDREFLLYDIIEDNHRFAWSEKWLTSSLINPYQSIMKFCGEVCILECSQECPLYKYSHENR